MDLLKRTYFDGVPEFSRKGKSFSYIKLHKSETARALFTYIYFSLSNSP